jgi:hypothetical protein
MYVTLEGILKEILCIIYTNLFGETERKLLQIGQTFSDCYLLLHLECKLT